MGWLRRWRFRRQVGEIRPLDLDEVIGPLLVPDLNDRRQAPAMPRANQHRYTGGDNTDRRWRRLLTPNGPGLLVYRSGHRSPFGRNLPS